MICYAVGTSIYGLLRELRVMGELIVNQIKRMPNTLDHGDISLHNTFIKNLSNKQDVVFIDFEASSIRPMIMMLEHLGEGYESIPHTYEGVTLAMRSFFSSWNEFSEKNIRWQDFIDSQLNARAYYKMGKYIYWIERILRGRKVEETIKWINEDQRQLIDIITKLQ